MADHKNITLVDIGCCFCKGESEQTEVIIHCITDNAVLVAFNSNRILERWVDLKIERGVCIDVSSNLVVCGGSGGLVRLFEPGTLKYIATLPKPDPLFMNIDGSISVKCDSVIFPTAVSVRKISHVSSDYIMALYSNNQIIVWNVFNLKKITRHFSTMFHCDCVWGAKVLFEDNLGS